MHPRQKEDLASAEVWPDLQSTACQWAELLTCAAAVQE